MPEFSAMELESREISPVVSTRLVDHALKFFSGALFTAALVAGGAVVVLVALTVGVVGAPVIAAALGWWALRRRSPAPMPAPGRAA
jgi:hypothetical protein